MGVKLLMRLQLPLLLFSCFLLQLSASTSVSNKTVDAQAAPSSENQSHDGEGCDPGWFSRPNGKKCFKYNATSLQWDESEIYSTVLEETLLP